MQTPSYYQPIAISNPEEKAHIDTLCEFFGNERFRLAYEFMVNQMVRNAIKAQLDSAVHVPDGVAGFYQHKGIHLGLTQVQKTVEAELAARRERNEAIGGRLERAGSINEDEQ